MRAGRVLITLVVSSGAALLCGELTMAQTPARGAAAQAPARGAAAPAGRGAAPAGGRQVFADLAQLMRAIPFPNSNIIFDVQDNDPAKKKPDTAGPYQGTYQGWEGVENAGLAIAEFATLLLQPGRMCSNGKPVPVNQPDFVKFAQALRTVGMEEYNAARTKKADAVNALSDKLTDTCANCHDKYRPDSRIGGKKLGVELRCTPGV